MEVNPGGAGIRERLRQSLFKSGSSVEEAMGIVEDQDKWPIVRQAQKLGEERRPTRNPGILTAVFGRSVDVVCSFRCRRNGKPRADSVAEVTANEWIRPGGTAEPNAWIPFARTSYEG